MKQISEAEFRELASKLHVTWNSDFADEFLEAFLDHSPQIFRRNAAGDADAEADRPRFTIIKTFVADKTYCAKSELEAHKSVSHGKHVAALLSAGVISGNLFIETEYVSGGDMLTWCDDRPDMSELSLAFLHVAKAVKFLHQNLWIHYDVKSENVLVGRNSETGKRVFKLCDFGLSRKCQVGEKLSVFCGAIEYAAPEIRLKGLSDFAADVWSFGILMFVAIAWDYPKVIDTLVGYQCGIKIPSIATQLKNLCELHNELQVVLVRCLKVKPSSRLTFDEICLKLRIVHKANKIHDAPI